MLMNDFVKALKESRSAMTVGKPSSTGKESQGERKVPVAKLPPRLNAAEKPKEVAKPKMGEVKVKTPTANVGKPTNDGIAYSGRIPVKVEHMKEGEVSALSDDDLVLED